MKSYLLIIAYYAVWVLGVPFNIIGILCTKLIIKLGKILMRIDRELQNL